MQKLFSGQQSGMFAWTANMIRTVCPKIPISVSIQGLYAPSRQAMPVPLRGTFFREVLQGYVRSLVIETTDGRHLTVGCKHAVEEDIAATSVRLTYYPEIDLNQQLTAATSDARAEDLAAILARAIVAFDNTDPNHQAGVARFIEQHGCALLSHPSAEVGRRFVILMKQMALQRETVQLLLRALNDPRDEVREAAFMDLAAYPEVAQESEFERMLFDALGRAHENVRAYASEACGFLGGSAAAVKLLPLLFAPEDHVREAAFVALQGLMQRHTINLRTTDKEQILSACFEALGTQAKGVLQAAALQLGLSVDGRNRRLMAEVIDGLREPLDLTAEDQPFRLSIFYRTTLITLLAQHVHLFVDIEELRNKEREALYALAEELRSLYETQHETFWCSYLREYIMPRPKKRGQVFVDFAHANTDFTQVVTQLEKDLKKAGVHLFISRDNNPLFSENVFIPKVYRPIQESELILVDISRNNFNVGYELGIAEKFSVPVVLSVSSKADGPIFDICGHYTHFKYDPDDPQSMAEFKGRLAEHLKNAVREIAASRADFKL